MLTMIKFGDVYPSVGKQVCIYKKTQILVFPRNGENQGEQALNL